MAQGIEPLRSELEEQLSLLSENNIAPIEQGSVADVRVKPELIPLKEAKNDESGSEDENGGEVNKQISYTNKRLSASVSAESISAIFRLRSPASKSAKNNQNKSPSINASDEDYYVDANPEPYSRPGSSYLTAPSSLGSSPSGSGFGVSRSTSAISLPGLASNYSINGDSESTVGDSQQKPKTQITFWRKSLSTKLKYIKSKFYENTEIDLGDKPFFEKTFSDKMKYLGVKTLYYTTGIDIKKSKPLEPGEKPLTATQKILKYFMTVVIAVASGMTTAVQFLASPHSLFVHLVIAVLGWAGYRVNFGVYNSTIEYTLKSFFVEGPLNEFNKTTGKWQKISSLKKCAAILIGTAVTYLGSFALTTFTFTSVKAALIVIGGLLGIASTACPPLLLALTIIISAISFVAIFTLMYKSMHSGIRDDKFDGLIQFFRNGFEFIKNIFTLSNKPTSQQSIKAGIVNFCKGLFTFVGVSSAIIATLATLGAWYNNLVKLITGINPALGGAAHVMSLILVFGFTAAGRIPMVIDVAAAVFSSIGAKIGRGIVSLGETLGLFTPDKTALQNNAKEPSIWQKIKYECTDKNGNFSTLNTCIFACKVATVVTGISLLTTLVVGSIFLNAGGNGKVADEGGSVLASMLGWIGIHTSEQVKSGLPYFAGGFFSATLGLNTANNDFELAEMTDSTQKINNGLTTAANDSKNSSAPQDAATDSNTTTNHKDATSSSNHKSRWCCFSWSSAARTSTEYSRLDSAAGVSTPQMTVRRN